MPRHPIVEVHRDGVATVLGPLDDRIGIREIDHARAALDSVIAEGLFEVEDRRWFDMREYFPSVQGYLDYRATRAPTSVIPDALMERMREETRAPGSELVLLERTRATRLRRLGA